MSNVLSPSLSKAARSLLKWTQADLSQKAGVGVRSVSRFEEGVEKPSPLVRDKLYRAFVENGIQFIACNHDDEALDGVGLRYRPNKPSTRIKIL